MLQVPQRAPRYSISACEREFSRGRSGLGLGREGIEEMELPGIAHPARDAVRNVTYNVLAYRQLSQQELLRTVRVFCATHKVKKNRVYQIVTTIGLRD